MRDSKAAMALLLFSASLSLAMWIVYLMMSRYARVIYLIRTEAACEDEVNPVDFNAMMNEVRKIQKENGGD